MTPYQFGRYIKLAVDKTFTPPAQSQLDALRQHLIQQGFHPSVASEQLSTARLQGMDKALEGVSQLKQQYPANDGVRGTAAVSSREYYFRHLNNNYSDPYSPRGQSEMPKYPAHMQKIPQRGTTTPAVGLPVKPQPTPLWSNRPAAPKPPQTTPVNK